MKRNNKNKNIQTFEVYPTLPEYQYVTGMPRYKNGAEYFSYDDYMTDTILADEGTETKLPPYLMKYNVDSSDPGNVLFGEKVEYGVPEFLRTSSPLAALLTGVSKFKNVGRDFKNAFANINPKTGKPYSKMDFARNTLTNTTDENVQINMENLINAYDKKGNIIDEKNTAENLFITQKDARANYFNELAKQHSKTYVDNEGNALLSQKQMDEFGNVTYVDPSGTRTVGDKVQDHIKDINAQRIIYDDDYKNVLEFSRYNDEGKKEVGTYDPNARYEEMEYEDIYNIQDELNEANQYLKGGGDFPRNNLAAFVYGGQNLQKYQGDVGPSETSEKTYRFNGVLVTKEEFDRLSKEAQNELNAGTPDWAKEGIFGETFKPYSFADDDQSTSTSDATTDGQAVTSTVTPTVTTPSMDEITGDPVLDVDLGTPDYMNPLGMNQEIPTNPNQITTYEVNTEGTPTDNTDIPVVEPESPASPLEMSFSKPDLTDEQKANMTEAEIKAYERQQKMDSAYNQANAFMNTGVIGTGKQVLREAGKYTTIGADTLNFVLGEGNRIVGELETDNEQDEVSDFMNPIEASRGDKGDFDINTGVYRATSLGYGDGPQGQLAQMGTETKGIPEPDYRSLQKFLNQTVVAYDPQTLLMQAKHGDEIIDADMKLIKDLMAAGADFEII